MLSFNLENESVRLKRDTTSFEISEFLRVRNRTFIFCFELYSFMKLLDFAMPGWFNTPEIVLYVIFALVTFFIAYRAYSIYKMCGHKPTAIFGLAFLGLSGSYLLQAILGLLIINRVSSQDIVGSLATNSVLTLSMFATILHVAAFTIALVLLAYVTLRERGIKIFALLLSITTLAMIFAKKHGMVFFLTTGIFLLFITAQHVQRFLKRPSLPKLFISAGFGMLFLGQMFLALAYKLCALYVPGLLLMLIGFLFLLRSLFEIKKK